MKNPVRSGIKQATFQLVAHRLNDLHKKGFTENASPLKILKITQFRGGERLYETTVDW
jgi:hypothetical protein